MNRTVLIVAALLCGAAGPLASVSRAPGSLLRAADITPDIDQHVVPRGQGSSFVTHDAPSGFTAAPVPNADRVPPVQSPGPQSAALTPSLFNPRDVYRGDGFLPKSTTQTDQERHLKPTPGINLRVPLE